MSDQNNIDNFFRNRFKDFEASPAPDLWDKISGRLDEKEAEEKKGGIVLLPWLYKAAGIAAAIALLFFIGTKFIGDNGPGIDSENQTTSTTNDNSSNNDANKTNNNSQVTDTNNNNSEQNSTQDKNDTSPEDAIQNKEQIANENTINNDVNKLENGKDSTVQKGSALQKVQNAVAQQNENQNTSNNSVNTTTLQNKNIGTQENAVANNTKGSDNQIGNDKIKGQEHISNKIEANAVANNTKNGSESNHKNTVKGSEANSNANAITNKNSSAVAQNDTQSNSNPTETTNSKSNTADATTNSETTNTETAVADTQKEEKDEIKRSILDVINDLHDLEKDKTEVAETNISKWTISPNASPVYYNTLSNGSPIDETFADNSKTGDINLSYGVNVGYDITDRLTVRSGIHRVEYSYNTKDIALVPSFDGPELTTIQFKNSNAGFNIQDRQAPTGETFSQYQFPTTETSTIFQKQIEGDLSQRMSYIEVPVELKYAVLDKKLGINVIGGVSTLLLTENSIILDSPELLTELGEATNVNDVSFSTNIGIGIDYKFSDQLEFNLEPMLKYQLNAFSGNTGNFNPYSVGVYTGVSFRF
ncbi:hypothetical protein [uncultured Kordia sp.]|uniref:hypothetical protein n=1 Tax=uncultured Kordia sp. TaxID=507699 RepID=UPI00262A8583|nr:hypothetical protein [uncultured Kordia sp.]